MKNIIKIIVLLMWGISYSQTYQINYERIKLNEYEGGKNYICPTELYTDGKTSIFLENKVINGRNTELEETKYRQGIKTGRETVGDSIGRFIVKNLVNKYYKQRTFSANYRKEVYKLITDSILPSFDWRITSEQKEILGYIVQKATTKYKNRFIEAWFTSEIPINDGVWKFNGLPGLILEVRIQFNEQKRTSMLYQAVMIKTIPKLPFIKIPDNISKISLEELEELQYQSTEKDFKFLKSKSKGTVTLRFDDLDFNPFIFPSK